MDATDASPSRTRAQDAHAKWSFHSLVVASGASAVESGTRNELLAALAADPQLGAHSHERSSYRIVRRAEVEETVRAMRVEAVRAEREAMKAAAAAETPPASDSSEPSGTETVPSVTTEAEDEGEIDVGAVALTPSAMALAFQRLVELDKQAFHTTPGAPADAAQSPAPSHSTQQAVSVARIFLLVDYPSTVAEVQALLLTGESGHARPHQSAPGIPLLPLLDGVLLVVDPTRELREQRRKSVSQSDERRKSLARRISTEAKDAADLADKQLPATPVFQTASPFVRDLYESASVGALEWSDFVFVDVACCSSTNHVKPAAELLRDLETTMATRVAQKAAFKDWVSSVKTVELPACDDASETVMATATHYEELLRPVFEPSVSVASVVWAMREAVVRGCGDGSDSTVASNNNASFPEAFIDHGDAAALRLALAYDLFTKQTSNGPRPCDACHIGGERIDAVEKMIWRTSDLPGVGNQGRKAMPVQPRLSDTERSVLDTEFATFATSSVPRVHLTRQLLRLEELLGQPWKGKLQLRDVAEPLHADVLPQRLASIFRDSPTVFKDYDEPTDTLLVAAITATAPGRFRTTSWSARDHVRHRPALKDWHREALPSDEYLTPRTALAATACVPLSAGQLGAVAEKCSVAYPADQSIIKMYQTPHAPAWVSVSLDGDVFGLRPRPVSAGVASEPPSKKLFAMQFYANLLDGAQLLIREGRERPKKPDGNASITASLSSLDDFLVTACSDGTIIIQRQVAVDVGSHEVPVERHRVISGKGAVVCVMSDASRRILFPNGDVFCRLNPESNEPKSDPLINTHRELTVDPETNAVVETRPGTGVVVVTHTDGSRVTYHTDGTTMYTTATRSHVLITKPGLAEVCIDVDVNLAAQRHSNGEKVAVTKGGLRTRSIIRATDGTQVRIQYNTKVVAEVNGRIVIDRLDGTKVVAKDSGRVEFTTRRTAATKTSQQTESSDDADRDELSHNRIYYFNCRDGNLSLVDHEQNHFRVDVGDGRGLATVNVDLAGVLSDADAEKYEVESIPAKAVINDPIEPFLFVLHGDGTGRELLRPRDVGEFLDTSAQAAAAVSEVSPVTPPPPSLVSSGGDWWSTRKLWNVERVFAQQLRPDPQQSVLAQRKWFDDEKLSACLERLATPVATAYCLVTEASLPPLSVPKNQFTVVRRLEQLRPLRSEDVGEMLATLDRWREWRSVREANKDRFKVVDPRDAEVVALEVAMQRKVVAAIKATRARKKAERQKQREQQRKSRVENGGGGAVHMETVQEGNEPQDGENSKGDDDDDLDQMFSDGTDDDSQSDIDVEADDPDELMWTAFSQADVEDSGWLSLAQVRRALVQVLGVGVTSTELTRQLHVFKQPEPFAVSFDVFVDLVHAFREGDDEPASSASPRGRGSNNQPADSPAAPGKPLAAGSATDAVRSFSLLRLNPSL